MSHGSSLTTRLFGDRVWSLADNSTPEDSEQLVVQVWSRHVLLGDDGGADSWLWEEICEGGLPKSPTVNKKKYNLHG